MLPNFLLIGPGHTGTSWITKNLMLHPDVYMPRCKSTRFFMENFKNGFDWYEAHFKSHGQPAIGEGSVGYFGRGEAIERIHTHMPNVKMIATFRDPVDRAYSAVRRSRETDLEQAIARKPELVNEARYATNLARIYSLFPRENVLVMFYEQLRSDPNSYLRRIYEFLGVDPDFDSPLLHQRINATSTFSDKSRVRKFAYRALLRLNFFRAAEIVESTIPKQPDPLAPEVRQRILEKYFLDEISRLEDMLGIDLSGWRLRASE